MSWKIPFSASVKGAPIEIDTMATLIHTSIVKHTDHIDLTILNTTAMAQDLTITIGMSAETWSVAAGATARIRCAVSNGSTVDLTGGASGLHAAGWVERYRGIA